MAALTGLRFVCVARVTADSWTTRAVLDSVADDGRCRDHHTPRIYGFQGYFSIPLFRPDGACFGTLCGLDPVPNELSTHKVTSTLKLFAQLISVQLENNRKLAEAEHALSNAAKRAWAAVCSLSPRLPSRMAARSPWCPMTLPQPSVSPCAASLLINQGCDGAAKLLQSLP
ncbi:UNVERIFIED_ORG: hypothetical protein JN05_01989 [Zoogloea ramigera]|uniref:GAF domain-containing protein n=1 Tax=Duganella zoogloeoides TaxID=75659 RepID=A0ABZ0Y4C4_9BURK|nr:hypothetical protein [Duganella zoogloeoides]WQH06236.1 hypothetical protein SR858_07885 [Duganella zoogloeoides]